MTTCVECGGPVKTRREKHYRYPRSAAYQTLSWTASTSLSVDAAERHTRGSRLSKGCIALSRRGSFTRRDGSRRKRSSFFGSPSAGRASISPNAWAPPQRRCHAGSMDARRWGPRPIGFYDSSWQRKHPSPSIRSTCLRNWRLTADPPSPQDCGSRGAPKAGNSSQALRSWRSQNSRGEPTPF